MITSPTLLLDEDKCRANIGRMARKAKNHGLEFKPHFKTHQSGDIGEWFRDEGVTGITVSSVKMAVYFARYGWKDITIAFPLNIRELDKINDLAKRVDLTLLLSDGNSLSALHEQLEAHVHVFIEIDTGANRSGFKVGHPEEIDQLLEKVHQQKHITCKGFYSHPGHSYSARSKKDILNIHADVIEQLTALKTRYDFPAEDFVTCIGDTPCCSAAEDFTAIDQISPGNFVFNDVMQTHIGSCTMKDIAVALACPVVATYPSRNEIIIHGGAIHLSKEMLHTDSLSHFGLPVVLEDSRWQEAVGNSYVKSISQEHGIITYPAGTLASLSVGDLLGILPVHSCLTADLMSGYRTLQGKYLNHIRNTLA